MGKKELKHLSRRAEVEDGDGDGDEDEDRMGSLGIRSIRYPGIRYEVSRLT